MMRTADEPPSGELNTVCTGVFPHGSIAGKNAGPLISSPVVLSQFESRLQRYAAGAFDAHHHVAPVFRILRVAQPVIGNAGAAGESDAPVDDQRLPVRSIVETSDRAPSHRVVPCDLAAAVFQCLEYLFSDR
jgi:hypothetical protein